MRKLIFIIALFFSTNLLANNNCSRSGNTSFDDWSWTTNNIEDSIDIDFYNQSEFRINKIEITLKKPNKKDKVFTYATFYKLPGPKSSSSIKIRINNMNSIEGYNKASLRGYYTYDDFDCLMKNAKKNETKNNNNIPKYFNKTIYNNCVLSNLKEGMNTSATGAVRIACRGKAENPSILDRLWYSW